MPPMEDLELIQLIRATNAGDSTNDLGSWMCRRCKKRASGTPSATSSREPTASVEGSTTRRDTGSSGVADIHVKQESVRGDSELDASSEYFLHRTLWWTLDL